MRILLTDPVHARELGERVGQGYERCFTVDHMLAGHEALYREVTARRDIAHPRPVSPVRP